MNRFVFPKIEQLKQLLGRIGNVQDMYVSKSFEFIQNLEKLLLDISNYYESQAMINNLSRTKVLRSELSTVINSYDPYTLDKIINNRRLKQATIGHKILKDVEEITRCEFDKQFSIFYQAEELIGNLILGALQSGIITNDDINIELGQNSGELLWQKIEAGNTLKLIQQKILLQVTTYDCFILIEKIIEKIRP